MAPKATIYKASIQLSDMDKNYYDTLNLTLAQHPSETEQRLLYRLVAFILNAHEHLQFGKGVSDEEEAAIWQINYSNEIELWIELGQLDEKRIKKACNKAQQVKLYCYGSSTDIWWKNIESKLQSFNNLSVEYFEVALIDQLQPLLKRSMEFQCSIQDGQLWLTCDETTVLIETQPLLATKKP